MKIFFIILAILASVYTAIRPIQAGKIRLDILSGPLLFLGLLILSGIIDFSIVKQGILGSGSLRPWEIIIIFYSVAYVSISVDLSGILDFFAFRIVRRAGGKGLLLFVLFYLFASLLTIFTSNDIVILTLTPIIFYLKKHSDIEIMPLLFAEFFGANTLSMLLYIGNPTNIIVGNALGLSFTEFTRIMALPTLAAALLNLILLFLVFRKSITRKYALKQEQKISLRNSYDALASTGLLILMLVSLIFSQRLGLKIWWITAGFAGIYILEDLFFSSLYIIKNPRLYLTELSSDMNEIYALYGFPSNRYDLFVILKRMPWKILPFLLTIFILVSGLARYGWVEQMASLLSHWSHSPLSSIFVNGSLAFFLSNLINNQPATVLYSTILAHPSFSASSLSRSGAAYALIIASNLGANLTLIGALAGIMWEKILQEKGVIIRYRDFLRTGILITPLVFIITLLILACII